MVVNKALQQRYRERVALMVPVSILGWLLRGPALLMHIV